MKTLSLKLDDQIYNETDELLGKIKKSRNRYINEAVQYYNRIQNEKLLEEQLEKESKLVSEESMKVMAEFEKLEGYDY